MTLLKGTIAASGIDEKLDEFDDGLDDMLSGASNMVDGTTELKDGMSSLVNGMGSLSSGLGKLSTGGKSLASGMSEYGDKLDGYFAGVESLTQVSADINSGFPACRKAAGVAKGYRILAAGFPACRTAARSLKHWPMHWQAAPIPTQRLWPTAYFRRWALWKALRTDWNLPAPG